MSNARCRNDCVFVVDEKKHLPAPCRDVPYTVSCENDPQFPPPAKKLRYVDDMKDKTLEKWIQFPQHPLIQLAGLLAYAF